MMLTLLTLLMKIKISRRRWQLPLLQGIQQLR
jgi:hypothetical protein